MTAPFSDRQRAAMERCHWLVRAGLGRLRNRAGGLDEADAHDIAVNALDRATRNHDRPDIALYFCCLDREFIDYLRSRRNAGGLTRAGNRRPAKVGLRDLWFLAGAADGIGDDEPDDWLLALAVYDPPAAEIRDECEAALRKLTPLQREILELRCYEGLYDVDIARRLGVSKSTVYYERLAASARAAV